MIDPYLKCLTRKVEWGFPDAIFDMANLAGPQVIAVLKNLERVGEQTFTLNTIHGRAQFALAKLGDEQAFQAIVHELDFGEFTQCINALQLIGGKKSEDALVKAFDSPNFLGSSRLRLTPETIAKYEKDRDTAIASALHNMIADPPDFTGEPEERKNKWKEWWARNRDTVQFVVPPMRTYE